MMVPENAQKIAILTDGVWPVNIGGMQVYSFNLAKAMIRRGCKVDLFLPAGEFNKPLYELFSIDERKKIEFIEVAFPDFVSFPGHYLLRMYLYSRNVFFSLKGRRENYAFIFVQGFPGWHLLGRRSAIDTPVGVHFHGYEMFQKFGSFRDRVVSFFFRKAVRYNIKRADFIFSLGGKISEIVEQITGDTDKIFYLPVGIDCADIRDTISPLNKDIRFVFVGRSERRKGLKELNLVLTSIWSDKIRFSFIGPISEKSQLKSEYFRYYGELKSRKAINDILDQSDVLVVPSLAEGMPTVILEAMSRGLAIIATQVGAVSELVNEKNGITVQAGDLSALKRAIKRMQATSEEDLTEMKMASLEKVRSFLWDVVADRLVTLITSRNS